MKYNSKDPVNGAFLQTKHYIPNKALESSIVEIVRKKKKIFFNFDFCFLKSIKIIDYSSSFVDKIESINSSGLNGFISSIFSPLVT